MVRSQRSPNQLVGTDPYAFARSNHTTYRLSRFRLARWIASQIMVVCSIHPGTPGTPPFCTEALTYWFAIMYRVSLWAMVAKKIFPSTFNSEIDLNCFRPRESFSLGIKMPSACFHSSLTVPVSHAFSMNT